MTFSFHRCMNTRSNHVQIQPTTADATLMHCSPYVEISKVKFSVLIIDFIPLRNVKLRINTVNSNPNNVKDSYTGSVTWCHAWVSGSNMIGNWMVSTEVDLSMPVWCTEENYYNHKNNLD